MASRPRKVLSPARTSKRLTAAQVDNAILDAAFGTSGEALIIDARAEISPAQMVERKLTALLNGEPLPISQVRIVRTLLRENEQEARGRNRAS